MFSNTKNVEVNGKTVKSIILENGAILYNKKNQPYLLSITSDKDILSYYDNDTTTLTATLTENNSPVSNEQVLFYDSDKVSLATYYDWLDVFLFTVTSENQGEIIFDTTNAEHNNFYTEDATSGGGYSNGGRVKFVITDTQVETWRYNSNTDTWTKSFMLYNLPVKIGFSYGTEIISDTAKIPFFASATTDSNGEATAIYNSSGIGDVNIKAEYEDLQETYELEDILYYADSINKIKSTFPSDTSVSGRTIYYSPFTIDKECEMVYKFKTTPPNSWVIGFGSNGTSFNSKGVFFRLQNYNSNKNSIMWIDTGATARDVGLSDSITSDNVLKINTTNLHKLNWYIDSKYVAYRDTYPNSPLGIRFDVFNNMDYEIDYIKLKAL